MNAWFEITEFPNRHRVRHMLAFMRGRAQQFYMMFIAPDIRPWTVESVGQALFNYCFPPVFRRQMRMKFNELSQGKRNVREYLRQLRSLVARLPDVNEFQLTQKYWDGANSYLRLKWTENGYTPEFSKLEELELAAERFENAEQLRLFELRKEGKDSRDSGSHIPLNRSVQNNSQKPTVKEDGGRPTFPRQTTGPAPHRFSSTRTGG